MSGEKTGVYKPSRPKTRLARKLENGIFECDGFCFDRKLMNKEKLEKIQVYY